MHRTSPFAARWGSAALLALAVALAAIVVVSPEAQAQRGGRGGGGGFVEPGANPPYDGRYTFVRIRYEQGLDQSMGFRRGGGLPPWAHDYPRGEHNFAKILAELTTIRARPDESVILALNDPELTKYPVAYMSEPGFWRPNDAEVAGLRTYLLKGGFIMFDDFRGRDWLNLAGQMQRVLPDLHFIRIDGTHPIFDAFYRVPDPESLVSYGEFLPTYWALFEDNDPKKRMIALANRDNDISEYWEWSGTGTDPVDLTNEAYKLGINFIVYALSR